jgi:L-ascorbate metabolism protein UlaG (beta-lactamase superfamily)
MRLSESKVGGKHILVDPLYLEPPAEHIDIDSLKADYILLTHAHGDHVLM